jgi:hypothetical protein
VLRLVDAKMDEWVKIVVSLVLGREPVAVMLSFKIEVVRS